MCLTNNQCGFCKECQETFNGEGTEVVYIPVPGPPGEPGEPGVAGNDGAPGGPGAPGLNPFEFWKLEQNRPNATIEDYYAFFRGEQGRNGSVGAIQTIFKQTLTNQKPETPDVDNLGDWSEQNPGVSPSFKYLWSTNRYTSDGVGGEFYEPALISIYAEKGIDGQDGSDIEFIYCLSQVDIKPGTPTSEQSDDFIPTGWSDNAAGPNEDSPYEFYSMRQKHAGVWGPFSIPSLWAVYSFSGEDGVDGKDVDYVFIRTSSRDEVPPVPHSENIDDYVPGGYTDDPVTVDENFKVQWGFKRTKNGSVWSAYSNPFVFTEFVEDGKDGKDVEYIYKRTAQYTTPSTPVAPDNTVDESIPVDWTDDLSGVSTSWPYEWRSYRKRTDSGVWGAYTAPRLFSRWAYDGVDGKDGDSVEYIFKLTADRTRPFTPESRTDVDDYVPGDWYDDAQDMTEELPFQWISSRNKKNGVWSSFSTPALTFHFAQDGKSGDRFEYIYKKTVENARPSIPDNSPSEDDFVPDGWTADAEDVSYTFPYGWRSMRSKANGSNLWGDFSTPRLVYIRGMDGADGADGKDYEFIYIRTVDRTDRPETPAGINQDDYVPNGWTDEPEDLTEELKYQWQSRRIRTAGDWGGFSEPKLVHSLGQDGVDGPGVEFVFKLSVNNVTPSAPVSENTDGYIPDGWTDNASSISEDYPFQFMAKRTKTDGVWNDFGLPQLVHVKGLDGADGRDGKDGEYYEFVFVLTATDTRPDTPNSVDVDDFVPNGWHDDAQSISTVYPYLWRSQRLKADDVWGDFSQPKLVAVKAIDGVDGDSVEYIYRRTADYTRPTRPTSISQVDDFVPDGWTDDPQDVTDIYPYQWISKREKTSGNWGGFSSPALAYVKGLNGDDGKDGLDGDDGMDGQDGLDGRDGRDGKDGDIYEYIFKLTYENVRPITPRTNQQSDFVPDGWTDDVEDVSYAYPFSWRSRRVFRDGVWGEFSTPKLIYVRGVDGADGEDGKYYEYIYIRTSTNTVRPDVPTSPNVDDFVPEGWTDDAEDLTESLPYQWRSRRLKVSDRWGEFSSPVLIHSLGQDGVDGPGSEFIFYRSTTNITPQTPTSNNTDGFIPEGWTDNGSSLSGEYPFQFMSKRIKTGGVWGNFGTPKLVHVLGLDGTDGRDGIDGKYYEFIYLLTSSDVTPTIPESEDIDDFVPYGWNDDAISVTTNQPYLWRSRRLKADGVWGEFSEPKIIGIKGVDGKDAAFKEYIFIRTTTFSRPTRPLVSPNTDDYVPVGWTDDPQDVSDIYPYQWVSTRTKSNGVWSAFGSPTLAFSRGANGNNGSNGSNGLDGRDGRDGTDGSDGIDGIDGRDGVDGVLYEYIYQLTNENKRPAIPVNVQINDYVPTGWTDDAEDVSATYPYIWRSTRKKLNGIWGDFTIPRLVYIKGMDGADGRDGKDYEYVYKRTTTDVAPVKPDSYQIDDYIPDTWTDDAVGVSDSFPFEWRCQRIKEDRLWGEFSEPKLVHVKGAPGVSGAAIILRGDWSHQAQYSGTSVTQDVVKFTDNGKGYIAKKNIGNIPVGTLPTNTDCWDEFTENMDSVMVDILVAYRAYVQELTVGQVQTAVESERFTVGFSPSDTSDPTKNWSVHGIRQYYESGRPMIYQGIVESYIWKDGSATHTLTNEPATIYFKDEDLSPPALVISAKFNGTISYVETPSVPLYASAVLFKLPWITTVDNVAHEFLNEVGEPTNKSGEYVLKPSYWCGVSVRNTKRLGYKGGSGHILNCHRKENTYRMTPVDGGATIPDGFYLRSFSATRIVSDTTQYSEANLGFNIIRVASGQIIHTINGASFTGKITNTPNYSFELDTCDITIPYVSF